MPDVHWTVQTKNNGVIIADAMLGELPSYTRGDRTTVTLLFDGSTFGARSATGFTFGNDPVTNNGGTDTAATWGGANGATYGGVVDDETERYRQLRDFGDYAGAAATGTSQTHVPWYREQLPSSAPVDSEVVALEPAPAIADTVPGFWGLIVDVTDETRPTLTGHTLALELVVLAERGEYADHTALENDLAA